MKHRIDPTVDCVFKAILGMENNTLSLVHFLNAVLKPDENSKIKEAVVINPYNEQDFQTDKLTIVDVKARDEKGDLYQIEIQLEVSSALKQRILYTWSHMYHSMLNTGDDYPVLKKAISIWIVAKSLFPECNEYHLPFSVYNLQHKLLLLDHMQIHIVQLPKWKWQGMIREELDRWMYLLIYGKELDVENLPEILMVKELIPAMETMKRFSENETDYDLYMNRRLAIWEANATKRELELEREKLEKERKEKEREREEKEREREEKEREREEKERALKELEKERLEKERLLNLLKQAGIDPSQES